ncbi:LAMI_0G03928g1_1 [Lachancea mirantina]|uniref:LAMI_0G03928g1_1 n=1 Tax=Lachancea mirantina TaxID=1230905 RepID=A0A1G4K8A1_9SACH|nr:LAMI_0G03928g1_1 [Lachancea mirantina]
MPKKASQYNSQSEFTKSSLISGFKYPKAALSRPLRGSYEYLPIPETHLHDKVITIDKFLDFKACQCLVTTFEGSGLMGKFHTKGTKDYAKRSNKRFSCHDQEFAQLLWVKLSDCLLQEPHIANELGFNKAQGLNPQLRVYCYDKDDHFDKHYDDSVQVHNVGTTQWTLLIYLTGGDPLSGGNTIFYDEFTKAPTGFHPTQGLALLHKHGNDCLLHEAQRVIKGQKWVLRSDVIF